MPATKTVTEMLAPDEIKRLLDSFHALEPSLDLAIAELDGTPVAIVGEWPPGAMEALRGLTGTGEVRFYSLGNGAQQVGMLGVHGKATSATRAIEKALHTALTLVVNQTALSKSQTDLLRTTQTHAMQLEIVMGITQELTATLDLEKLLNIIMRSAVAILQAMSGSLFLVDPDSGDLVFRVVTSGEQNLIGSHIPRGQGVVGQAAATGQPVVSHDVKGTKEFYGKLDHEGFQTQSLLAAPLKVADQVIGVVEAVNKADGSVFDDDDINLLTTFAAQAAIAIENARLMGETVIKQRMEHELQMAFDVQASLIPQQTPQIDGWEFAGWWQPAREVSGDFYDFPPRTDGKLGVTIADVSDKGMHAALFMALTRSIVRASAGSGVTPAENIARVNRLVCADSTGGMFVTLFYAELDPQTGETTMVNCGHNPPLLARAGQDGLETIRRTGIMLGFDADASFGETVITLQPGDVLALYTDGVPEAFSPSGEAFGMDRLSQIIASHKHEPADAIMSALRAALENHLGDVAPSDDITVALVRRTA